MAAERRLAGGDGFIATTRYHLGTSGNRRKDGGLAQGFRGYGAVGRRGRRVVVRERRAAADHRGADL
jgi:hypothetical protein